MLRLLARWIWRHPLLWLVLAVWAALAALVHEFVPIVPVHRCELATATRVHDDLAQHTPIKRDNKRKQMVVGVTADGNTACTVVDTDDRNRYHAPLRLWDIDKGDLAKEMESSQLMFAPHWRVVYGDWLAVRFSIPPKDNWDWRKTTYKTDFFHTPTGTHGLTIDDWNFG